MKKTILFLCFALIGCIPKIHYVPPTTTYTPSTVTVNAPYDKVWTATVRAFAKRNWNIQNMEKASGYISKDWTPWDLAQASEFIDIGNQTITGGWPTIDFRVDRIELKYNIMITRVDDNRSAIDITLNGRAFWYVYDSLIGRANYSPEQMYGQSTTQCRSTGIFEKILIDEIKKTAIR